MEKKFCTKCGAQNEPAAAFCSQCGQAMAAAMMPPAPGMPPQPPAPNAPPGVPPVTYPVADSLQYTMVREINYPKASNGSRFLAYLVDGLICSLPLLPGLGFFFVSGMEPVGVIWMIITGCWGIYYSFCKDGFGTGQSYGKKMNGLMVVNLETNQPCSKGKSALRALSFCIPYLGLVEIVMVLAHEKGRRLGDLFAKTQVIAVEQYKRQ